MKQEIQKEKLLSLKGKQPATRKENTVLKIVFRKDDYLVLISFRTLLFSP